MNKINIFISYCHNDEEFKDRLVHSLAPLKKNANIIPWEDRKLLPGQDWNSEIKKQLRNAQIVLLLLSPDFLASRYCQEVETKIALEMHKKMETNVVPIFVRPCYLDNSSLVSLNGLPKDRKWISSSENIDEAFLEIVKGMDRLLKSISAKLINEEKKNELKFQVDQLRGRKKIFVSFVSDYLEEKRKKVYDELQGAIDYKEWPFELCPSPKEKTDFLNLTNSSKEEFLTHYLKDSAFSIHFAPNSDNYNDELFRTQISHAEKISENSPLKCLLAYNSGTPLLPEIMQAIRQNPNFIGVSHWNEHLLMESLATEMVNNETLKNQYINQIKKLQATEKKVFLIHENIDSSSELRKELRALLKRKKLIVLQTIGNDFEDDDFDPKKYEEEQFQMCNGAIILYGKATENWCLLKQHKIRKMNIPARGICFDDPDKEEKIDSVGCYDFLSINEQENLERDIEVFASQLNATN